MMSTQCEGLVFSNPSVYRLIYGLENTGRGRQFATIGHSVMRGFAIQVAYTA